MTPAAHFTSCSGYTGWSAAFSQPGHHAAAYRLDDVLPLLQQAEAAAKAGSWVALALLYESAPAFDRALGAKTPSGFPLAWMGVFDQPLPEPEQPVPEGAFALSDLEPQLSRDDYRRAVESIKRYIERGDTYEVNFTFPMVGSLLGDSYSCFRRIGQSQRAAYGAYLDIGSHRILSFSPELFLERHGNQITVRPMKGTLARGRWLEEDDERVEELRASEKQRAENVMIVDLLRSDLGKIAEIGSVRVTNLFAVERLNRVLQMTSTITATHRPEISLTNILCAAFPSGSVTGAPKPRTMAIISELERQPRNVYTGAIGLLYPNGDAVFSVAIRTLLVEAGTGVATFGVGSAITWDSTPTEEYDECCLKAKFLTDPWDEFELLETIALEDGQFLLLDEHLSRCRSSAAYFGFRWNETEVLKALDALREEHPAGLWRARLTVDRRACARAEASPLSVERAAPLEVRFATRPVADSDPLLFHKTTARGRIERELALCRPCDDVIFWNSRGEVTESSIANVVVFDGAKYWTPPRTAGLLAGTFRNDLIARGKLNERTIHKAELEGAQSFFLVNSVRGWMEAVLAPGAKEKPRSV